MAQSIRTIFGGERRVAVWIPALCVVTMVCLTCNGLAAASTAGRLTRSAAAHPNACERVSYTGDGGYYSQGQFYWEPADTVTVTTRWCAANGVITSHTVTYMTTIPDSLNPQFSLSATLVKKETVLDVAIGGDYDAGVLNNVGFISIVGHVTGSGHHHFVNDPNAGG